MNNTNDKAYILIDKFHSGQATQDEVAYLQEWRNSSASNSKLFDELNILLNLISNLKEWRQFDKKKAWNKFQMKVGRKTLRLTRQIMAAAAVLLVVLAATIWNFSGSTINADRAFISGDESKFSLLADGSELFLSEGAKIYTSNFKKDSRFLRTEGNYFVHVASDESAPFVLETDKVSIQVLGTSFKVEESEDATSVKVREGKVLITNHDGSSYELKGGQQLVMKGRDVSVSKFTRADWGLFEKSYKDESLFNLFSDLSEEYGNLKINASGINSSCLITTKISESTILEIIEELDLLFDIDYSTKDGIITIERISC